MPNPHPPDTLDQPRSIVVFRALQLGDMLCAIPAFRALRHAYPDAHIALIGLPWCQSFVSRFAAYIDEFIEFPGYPGLPEITPRLTAIPAFLAAMQQRHFDAAIQLHGSGSYVNSIAVLLNAKRMAGFYLEGEYCPDPQGFMQWPENEPEILRYLKLMEYLGLSGADATLEFPLTAADRNEFNELRLDSILGGRRYIVIHPGAQLRSRRWPALRFAQVAESIPGDFAIVITGTADEQSIAESVQLSTKRDVVNLAGKTSLGALAVLLQNAQLLISNDTGLSHIAAALHVPSVVICSASDPHRWSPLDRSLHTVIFHQPVACRPCAHELCPIGHPCALELSVDQVTAVVLKKICATGQAVSGLHSIINENTEIQ